MSVDDFCCPDSGTCIRIFMSSSLAQPIWQRESPLHAMSAMTSSLGPRCVTQRNRSEDLDHECSWLDTSTERMNITHSMFRSKLLRKRAQQFSVIRTPATNKSRSATT